MSSTMPRRHWMALVCAIIAAPSPLSAEAALDRLSDLERRLGELERRLEAAPSATPPTTVTTPSSTPSGLPRRRAREGWVVDLRDVADGRVSDVSLGQIVVPPGTLALNQHVQRGVQLASSPAYRAEGLLVARREGQWTIQALLEHPGAPRRMDWRPTCIVEFWIAHEQNKIRLDLPGGNGPQVADRSLTVLLAPGLHRLGATLACLDAAGPERAASVALNRDARMTLRLKGPDDIGIRAPRGDEIVHIVD